MPQRGLRHSGMKQPRQDESEVRTTTLSVAGMSCAACVRHVTRAMDGMSGVVHIEVDLERGEATVEHVPAFADAAALAAAIRDAGYSARVTNTVDDVGLQPASVAGRVTCACGCCGPSRDSSGALVADTMA